MSDAELRLDANSAAGLLTEIFAFDVTTAEAVCAGCGATGPVGSLMAYGLTMGAVLRCPGCDTAVMRISQLASGYWIDSRGMSVLRIRTGVAPAR